MKRISLILSLALALWTGGMNARAQGCCGFWPFIPLVMGLGFGLAAAASSQSHAYPAYVYAGPTYSYYYPPAAANPTPAAPYVNTEVRSDVWIPSTSGAGHWVPDPTPYQYSEAQTAPSFKVPVRDNSGYTVTVARSPGKVPVYVVSR
jgi:hypothetical protein